MKELLLGIYALWIYLPISGLLRKWRRKKLRGRNKKLLQQIALPSISWRQCVNSMSVGLWEPKKANGNIRISELAILNLIAKEVDNDTNLFEIGTFDGRTSLNLAFSSPDTCKIYTLDLKPEMKMKTKYKLLSDEQHMVNKMMPGARIEKYKMTNKNITNKIHQLFGDSAKFDFSPYYNSCSFVFVDGSHAYDYVMSDTKEALKMVKKGGVIIWHDYGIWEGVTKALEEIESIDKIGLVTINGTSLVYWKNE